MAGAGVGVGGILGVFLKTRRKRCASRALLRTLQTGRFQYRFDVAGEEFLEFEAGLGGASFDLAKERVRDFERGAHGNILAQKHTGLNPDCLGAGKEDGKDDLARTLGTPR